LIHKGETAMGKIKIYKPSKVRYNPETSGFGFADDEFSWSLCDKSPEGKVEILTAPVYCRESLIDSFADLYSLGKLHNSRNKLRLLARVAAFEDQYDERRRLRKKFEKICNHGLKNLNLVEAKYGWPLTKTYEAKLKFRVGQYAKVKVFSKLFLASTKWKRSPHMISLFCLMVRVGNAQSISAKTYQDFEEVCKSSSSKGRDVRSLKLSARYWPIIFGRSEELFAGLSVSDAFDEKNYPCTGMKSLLPYDGIDKLCKGESSNEKLKINFNKLRKEVLA